jgi:Zn-dependent protease with chaperone function
MEHLNLTYSQELQSIDEDVLKPSKEFKKHVVNIVNAIASFAIVYLILFTCIIIIAGGMIAAGFFLLANISQFLVLILGIGFILSGAMLIFFLIKFLFAKNAQQVSRNEITEEIQPELFNFIRELTIECGAPFPKHIYIIPETNASVFFDSSFWSMFFPVKKNLNIGLALVNSLNVSEFKAVLMHEFGHFSQRSMRFGSYVYNLNKVLYDMLYKNDSYNKILNIWGRWHMVLKFAALLNIKIVQGMQYILKKLHVNINKKHLGLSREMEFHADTIAAYYGGSNNMISALRRLELGNNSYNAVLSFLGKQFEKGYRSNNVYPEQLIALNFFSKDHNLITDEAGLPIVNKSVASLNKSRVIVDNEWASHPTDNDREYSLIRLNIIKPTINKSAWSLFTNVEALQEYITKSLYNATDDKRILEIEAFKTFFNDEINASVYDKVYKGFYDSRLINAFDIDEAINETYLSTIGFNELLNDKNRDLPSVITGIQKDIALLDTISNNDNSKFEFEGIKYNSYDTSKVKKQLLEQLEDARQKLTELDRNIFLFFYHLANDDTSKQIIADGYRSIFKYQKNAETDYELYNSIMFDMSPVYTKMKPGAIQSTLNKVYDKEEGVKTRIKDILKDNEIRTCITEKQKKDIETYLSYNWIYYDPPSYNNSAIDIFNNGLNAYISSISEHIFIKKKSLFDFQRSMMNE